MYEKLLYSVQDGVANVVMNYPKNLNAMDEILIGELVKVFEECDKDPNVKVVVLSSAAPAFCGGGDIAFMYQGIKQGNVDFETNLRMAAMTSRAIKKCSKPVIASVKGAAAGGGFIVALACDYIIAAENAVFTCAFVNIGLAPDSGGFYILDKALGLNKAMELALTGRVVKVDEAKQLGFVADVVPVEELEAATAKLAKRFAAGPSMSYAAQKKLVYDLEFAGFDEFVKSEVEAQLVLVDSQDFKDRVCAFVEKKKK